MSLTILVDGIPRTLDYFLISPPHSSLVPGAVASLESVAASEEWYWKSLDERPLIRPSRFWYKCSYKDIRAVDGDTVAVDMDLTLGASLQVRIRLASINAPKLEKEDNSDSPGNRSQAFLRNLIQAQTHLWIKTLQNKKDEPKKTFDRYIAFLFTPKGQCINDIMVGEGMATPYMIEVLDEGESFILVDNPS
jgi:endonuclease YncB( thermonuclease family)